MRKDMLGIVLERLQAAQSRFSQELTMGNKGQSRSTEKKPNQSYL